MPSGTGLLLRLAQLYGVQTAYYGLNKKRHVANIDALMAVLQSLGAPIASLKDIPGAHHSRLNQLYDRIIDPVLVAWEGKLDSLPVRLCESDAQGKIRIILSGEDGSKIEWSVSAADFLVTRRIEHNNFVYFEKNIRLGINIPYGYHRLIFDIDKRHSETIVFSAPIQTYKVETDKRNWGVFLPLYSLHTRNGWGTGSFTDLTKLIDWMGELGGSTLASLPLLPTFLDKPYEPSPYLPVSKLFWNEFFIDVAGVPELENCQEALVIINSHVFQKQINAIKAARLVDYRQQMKLKTQVLKILSRHFFNHQTQRRKLFESYISEHPDVETYAKFRAAVERNNTTWNNWQARQRKGEIGKADFDEESSRYYAYIQWLAHEQIKNAAQHVSRKNTGLYLDLPLGTHPYGYDTWRYRDIFLKNVSAGAPPDIVFTNGQNWSFPPLHPEQIRETGYSYVIRYLRHHLELAKTLRVDHIMGLHRLFFIPAGFSANQGMYVHYHPGELYAIYCIESQRHKCVIVGEDLGIVPKVVRIEMKRHGFQRMWIMYYELAANNKQLLSSPQRDMVAGLNTHDMPTFASFWKMRDISDRIKTGIISERTARKDKVDRAVVKQKLLDYLAARELLDNYSKGAHRVLKGALSFLALSRARLLLINLEDLWLETDSQNIPGTTKEHPNWRRKSLYDLETFCQNTQVVTILKEINSLRKLKRK